MGVKLLPNTKDSTRAVWSPLGPSVSAQSTPIYISRDHLRGVKAAGWRSGNVELATAAARSAPCPWRDRWGPVGAGGPADCQTDRSVEATSLNSRPDRGVKAGSAAMIRRPERLPRPRGL